jgi:ATP-binding cassette, subfamily B, multidrug efflux pump
VQRGRITLDGRDIRDVPRADLRRRIGLVLQEPFLFAGTIEENIAIGNPGLDRPAVERAARHVNAHHFIERLPRGYDTELTGRGGGLSSGEKQLLALARALAQDPDIVLVLDEATANVDTETEVLIRDALRRLMRERTTIAIAHRLSTIRDADRILVMQAGRIAAQGTHDDLMAVDGEYRRLYELLSIGRR